MRYEEEWIGAVVARIAENGNLDGIGGANQRHNRCGAPEAPKNLLT
ncbi:hypothetical protein ABTY96_42065 [Streptomyces sp. NPDC096057]